MPAALLLETEYMVGVYCSDVSGAFDKVSKERVCQKLDRLGLHEDIFGFLCSWLDDRNSRVIAGGQQSKAEPLTNSVFQGTVLGPPLWNVHYGDANRATGKFGSLKQSLQMITIPRKDTKRTAETRRR